MQLGGITFVAAIVQGAVGFGFTLLAVAFFLLILGSSDAVPLLTIINLTISLSLMRKLWGDVVRELWGALVLGAALGLPVGLLAFSYAGVDDLKVGAAIAIMLFAVLAVVLQLRNVDVDRDLQFKTPGAIAVGAVAGAMTSSLGMPGPAVVLYLTVVGAGRDATRAITLTLFAVAYGASLMLQTVTVGVGREVWIQAAILLPVAAIGARVGHASARHLNEATFRRVVLALVLSTGVYLLLDTLLR